MVRSGTSLEVAELTWIAEGISRQTALSIPAVLMCRNLIVGAAVQLGVFRYRGGERLEPDYLLSRPDPSTTWPATIAGTVDDLVFRGRAYWLVLDRDSEGYARRARWTPVDDVTPETRSLGGAYSIVTGYQVAGVGQVAPADLIRFDSPFPGVLDVGGPVLSDALKLQDKIRRLTQTELPAGVLKNEGTELSEEEGKRLVAGFRAARLEQGGVAFLQGVDYSSENAATLDANTIAQLADVATSIARLFSIQVALIGASPSGGASALLYANLSQQLAIHATTAVTPYLRAVESTLSDVIPRGQSVAFDVPTYLRSDPEAAATYVIGLVGAGLISVAEGRSMLGMPSSPPAGDLTPGSV